MASNRHSPFLTARIRLTLWYMLISYLLLAATTIAAISAEQQAFQAVEDTVHSNVRGVVFNIYLQQQIDQFSTSFARRLIAFDVVVLVLATIASYILSGRTLRSIEDMVHEQEQFAADASHELRTPLANIAMEIEAHRRSKPGLAKDDARLLTSIQSEVERMRAIVAGLLTLVRQYQQEPAADAVDVSALATQALDSMQARFAAKKLHVQPLIEPQIQVLGRTDELRQLVLILLDNAVKYSPKFALVRVTLSVQSRLGHAWVVLVVHNSGSFIHPAEQQLIFRRFYRGQQVQESGTGLGLAIAKSLVEQYQGRIAVASSREYGTSFKVELPARD